MGKRLISIVMLQRTIKARTGAIVSAAYKNVQKPTLFAGLAREYTPKAEDGTPLPAEAQQVQLVATSLLQAIATDMTSYWDITATRDVGNQIARADIKVRGQVLLEDVPTSTLLFLEKQLIDVRTFVTACPTLDSAKEWTTDEVTGISRTRPTETTRSEKLEETVIVVPATEKHAAQTRDRTRDQIVGTWATTHFSGAFTTAQQHTLVGRINELIDAVKLAREEANVIVVDDVFVGDALFGFLLDR
jgi:hypothetical protein